MANSGDVVALVSRDGRFVEVGAGSLSVLGLPPESLRGKPALDCLHPDDREDAVRRLTSRGAGALAGAMGRFVCRVRHAAGGWRHMEMTALSLLDDPDVQGFAINARDVTDRVEAEQRARASDALYQTLAGSAPVGIFQTDREGRLVFANPRFAAIAGLPPDALSGHGWRAALHPDDRSRLEAEWARATAEGAPVLLNLRFCGADGRIAFTLCQGSPLIDPDGRVQGCVGTLTDMTEYVRTADALLVAEARTNAIVDAAADAIVTMDGEGIVHSRTGLLDGFLMVFALAAFGALLLDRDQARRRLAARTAAVLDSGAPLGLGPRLGWRWWRFAAAVLLGLAIGTKWSGLYFLAVFGLLSVAWDATARRTVGVRRWPLAALWRDAVPAALVMVPNAALVYVATWWSWFAHPGAYLRQWAVEHPGEGVTWLPPALRSLWHFHTQMWDFHTHLTAEHAYAAHPLGWIVQWRPTSFYYPDSVSGLTGAAAQDACGADACSQAITSLGNPVIWWLGALALVVALVVLVVRRDWRAGAVLSGVVAGWLPWFAYAHRTIFTFYSIAFAPWVVLALVYVLGLLLQSRDDAQRRRGIAATVAVTLVVLAVSAFFYPVWTAWVVPYDFWHLHMWLRSWI